MEETDDSCQRLTELYIQDGILLKQAQANYISFINTTGTLYITENRQNPEQRYIEWKQNDITVDSDIQDQDWAVVNTIQKRTRTLSGSLPPDSSRLKLLRFKLEDVRSFRHADKYRLLTFFDGKGDTICSFHFQHGNCELLVGQLRVIMKVVPSKRNKHLFMVLDPNNTEVQQLSKSFAELEIFNDGSSLFQLMKNFREQPYVTTVGAFAKITDYVYQSPEQKEIDEREREELNKSVTEYECTTSHSQGEYEVIAKVPELPQRMDFPRLLPLNKLQWEAHFDCYGKIEDVDSVKTLIFRGGVTPNLRLEVWKYLLDYFPWTSTELERKRIVVEKDEEYFKMKAQWKNMSKAQEDNFSEYRERKNLIEKDVNRTDRNLEFFAGDDNQNLQMLYDILMTYVMYNFDLGYVQGMSDLLSPILMLFQNEIDAFWCFVGFMNKVSINFDIDQSGMKKQLSDLHTLLGFVEPTLASYFDSRESGNMFFCFRWLLVWFKRELSTEGVMQLWEVLWTGYPCDNFHLLICVAILETEKENIISNNYGFTDILKHVNELSGKLDIPSMLNKAEGMFHQIKGAEHLTDSIRLILGLPLLGSNSFSSHEISPFEDSVESNPLPSCSVENIRISPDENSYENSLNHNFL